MTKIPEDQINRIKRETDILIEVKKRGIQLEKKGKEYVGLCPFHNEKTPSFHVNPVSQEWHCFGSGEGGDVISFLTRYDKKDFREVLANLDGSPNAQTVVKQNAVRPNENQKDTTISQTPSSQNEEYDSLIFDAILYYAKTLKNTPTALAYLQGRGLNHPELLKTFRIGYCDRTLGKLFPSTKRKAGGSPSDPSFRSRLKQGGILRKDGKEHFVGCLTFPVFKADSTLGEIYGRRTSKPRKDLSPHLYLPGLHQGVFNIKSIGHQSPLILCESIIDALSFWVHGFKHVTSSFGVNGFTEEMLKVIQSKGVKNVWIAYDNDDRGNQSADRLAPRLAKVGILVERVLLPKNMDVNQVMCEVSNPQEALKNLLNQRQSYTSPPLKDPCYNSLPGKPPV